MFATVWLRMEGGSMNAEFQVKTYPYKYHKNIQNMQLYSIFETIQHAKLAK